MTDLKLQEIESQLLTDAIFLRYGYDFRQYQPVALTNRYATYAANNGLPSVAAIIPLILRDSVLFNDLLVNISVTVTEMFREPHSYHHLRQNVVPLLKTYPYLNVWHAGCATGEEAYSMAIFLCEQGLLTRSQIYATDINRKSLDQASKGIYSIKDLQSYTKNYNSSGCLGSLSDYYHARYNRALMSESLRKKIVFSRHNLVTDGVFSEMHLISCKNVLIYFNRELQVRVLELFAQSLCRNGFLCLGEHESLELTPIREQFEVVDSSARIYRKVS